MSLLPNYNDNLLNNIFSALSHPIRRKMLDQLKSGKATVSELANPFDISMPAITKHLKILEEANLIVRDRDAQKRYAVLDAKAMKIAVNWMFDYRTYWSDNLDRLDEYIKYMAYSNST